jgi:serine protease
MNRSLGRTWVLAGLLAVGAAALPMQAVAGKRGGETPHNMPTFSAGLIVKLNDDSMLSPELLAKARAWATKHGYKLSHLRKLAKGGDLLELDKALPPEVLRRLSDELAKLDDRIDYVEPDVVMVPLAAANDKHFAAQWNLTDPAAGIFAHQAWAMSRGQGVVVAVVDTGVRPHIDLLPNLLPGHDFISNRAAARDGDGRDGQPWDEGNWTTAAQCTAGQLPEDSLWHGTHVAGAVAAVANNGLGIAGVAPAARVLPVRAVGRCGGRTSDIIDGMLWAAGLPVAGAPVNRHPAQVINLSLGSLTACSRSFQGAIDAVRAQGAVVVTAAGNSDTDVANVSPSGCNRVISVAASDRAGRLAYYSNHGRRITVAAPGGDMRDAAEGGVLSLYNAGTRRPAQDNLAYMQGTSMAAPQVSGVVALMLARQPGLSPDRVEELLRASARPMPGGPCLVGCGGGLVDAAAAVAAAAVAP